MNSITLAELGWDSFFLQQTFDDEPSNVVPVRVMNVHRSGLQVVGEGIDLHLQRGRNDEFLEATVGDWLLIAPDSERVIRRLERKSLFKRKAPGSDRREQLIAANVDSLFIVSSCNQDFNEARLERYLAIAKEAQVMSVIVLTKADLVEDSEDYVQKAARLAPGIQVEAINALQMETLQSLEAWLPRGQTVALLGSSGVGKSTLTNTLLGSQDIDTQDIREDDAKGRHTTTSRSMHQLPGGAWLLDTPGMRELQIIDAKSGLDDVFAEIQSLTGRCKFSDCAHISEPGCAVLDAVSNGEIDQARLERWRKLMREEAFNSATVAERKSRDKAFGRMIKNVLNEKEARKKT